MNTTVVNFKTDAKIKRGAQAVAKDLGFSLSSVLNAYLRNLIRTRKVEFSDDVRLEPTAYLKRVLRQSEKDIKEGRVISFSPPSEALSYLDRMIAHGQKHQSRRLHQALRQTTP